MVPTSLPLANPVVWLLWGVHAALFLLLPGWLGFGRFLKDADPLVRCTLSVAAGLALAALYALFGSVIGPVLRPWHYLAVVLFLALLPGLSCRWRDAVRSLTPPEWRLRGSVRWLVLAACPALFLPTMFGQVLFEAPPGLGAGHTLLTINVAEARTIAAAAALDGLHVEPGLTHGLGWHAAAALTAQVGRLDEFLTTWLLPLGLVLGLPVAFWLAWRAVGVGARAAAWATLILPAMFGVPEEVLTWGGLGQIVGWYLAAPVLLAARSAWRRGGTAAGLLLGLAALVLVVANALEAAPVLILSFVVIAVANRPWSGVGRFMATARKRWPAFAIAAAVVLAGGAVAVLRCGLSPVASLSPAVLSDAGGGPLFFGNFLRLSHLVLFVLIPAAGWCATAAWRRVRPSKPLAVVFSLACWLWIAVMGVAALSRQTVHSEDAPLPDADRTFAVAIGEAIVEGAVIANLPDDGSGWVSVISGSDFLIPVVWPGSGRDDESLRSAVLGLGAERWSESTLGLQALGVRYLYVNDGAATRPPVDDAPPFLRARFNIDPRFWPVVEGETATVYEILWVEVGYYLC